MKKNTEFEFSAGGIVKNDQEFLLIKVKYMGSNEIWTFPKGKLEKGENYEEAALREVLEETGYNCSIDGYLKDVKYLFMRKGKIVIKKVRWFAMIPGEKTDVPDSEIFEIRWADYNTAKKLLKYKLDLMLLDMNK